MDDLGRVTLTPELAEALVAGVDEELAGIDQTELTARARRAAGRAAHREVACERTAMTTRYEPAIDLDASSRSTCTSTSRPTRTATSPSTTS